MSDPSPAIDSTQEDAVRLIGYRFFRVDLLTEALTHASSAGHRLESNERLEFLGDAILGYVISEYLYQTFPTYQEGELTKIKSAVVSRKVCAQISSRLQLASLLNLGKGMSGRHNLPSSVAAAVLESVIAAIYLDGGIEPAKRFILDHFITSVNEVSSSSHQYNFKSLLQQYAQRHLPSNPHYTVLDEKGPDHSKCFEVCVQIAGKRYTSAWANTKKEAEQKAALLALCELGITMMDEKGNVQMCPSQLSSPQTPEQTDSV